MNSEELEKSLRGEFESYLKDRFEELQKGVSEFQQKINEDFEKQKEHLDESFRELNEKLGSGTELEMSFTESVTEHLKLARDEGAQITANAIAEAEKLDEGKHDSEGVSVLSEAIEDISTKSSQSEILKSLVAHASDFTPRGAFFIVKNEHLVGWRVFGREDHEDPKVVREVFFPVASDTALSEAVRTLTTINSAIQDGEDDVMYRSKLGFEGDSSLHAIPLVARGRGVAVLYADGGESGGSVDVSAIKALMKVAGLTVEVLASQPSGSKADEARVEPAPEYQPEEVSAEPVSEVAPEVSEAGDTAEFETSAPAAFVSENEFAPVPQPDAIEAEAPIHQPEEGFETEQPVAFEQTESDATTWTPEAEDAQSSEVDADSIPSLDDFAQSEDFSAEPSVEEYSVETEQESSDFSFSSDDSSIDEPAYSFETESFDSVDPAPSDYSFETPQAEEPVVETNEFESFSEEPVEAPSESEVDISRFDTEPLESPVAAEEVSSDYDFSIPATPSIDETVEVEEPVAEESVEESVVAEPEQIVAPESEETVEEEAPAEEPAPKVRSRFAERNLDLPIEVAEDERRFHNDARRFARLLVSEIKLYNEQKVKEGRESGDLYERLREAIDRSREMYDKRVQAPVAAKFDYFNYELVNTLAEGDEGKLGASYPGPAV